MSALFVKSTEAASNLLVPFSQNLLYLTNFSQIFYADLHVHMLNVISVDCWVTATVFGVVKDEHVFVIAVYFVNHERV